MTTDNIILMENNVIFDDDRKVCEIFSEFFSNVAKNLNVVINDEFCDVNETDPIFKAIEKYAKHPSILKIKDNVSREYIFISTHYL